MLAQKVSESFITNLTFISTNIEKELGQWELISKYFVANPVIREVLGTTYARDVDFHLDMKRVYRELDSYSINTNIFAYISSLVIFGNKGRNILYGDNVSTLKINKIKEQPWFQGLGSSHEQVVWLGSHKNYADYRVQDEDVIGLARVIKGNSNYQNLGVLYLAISPKYFFDLLGKVNLHAGSRLYVIDNNDRVVFDSENELTNQLYNKMDDIRAKSNEHYIVEKNENGEKILLAYTPIKKYGWWTVQTIAYDSLMEGKKDIFRSTLVVFLVSFLFATCVWYFVSLNILQPIKQLTDTMKKVENGNLHARATIKRSDEIGLMSQHFNNMIDKIQELFISNMKEQEKKKIAEYRALQAQINPHFLYNTLNTIRWMAIIQKASSIQEVVEVLGRLLKGIFKSEAPFITLEEEISNLRDYIYIQKLRYNNKFSVRYDLEHEVLSEACIKFILQPIVENSIFHGIQPKETNGEIVISAHRKHDQIILSIWDNGIGMTKEEIDRAMNNISNTCGIGLGNVAERLKLTYGEKYGLTIQSKKDIFTKIEIVYPVIIDINDESN
ncbi:histidine kinase [Neobacillus kokaensis]|uniref:Histidine kinase n=2 Tax=Neobacillus kokaensis TaxID=2759023 RepID=A0ABQ3N7B6_9BACI|nr:histidine kinase [Neobacillus kokaensis]